ncbi:MAG: hypothetical protein MRY83_00435 [Flavobacteriales bacterium]|nr:hypothetical protein [Flavobacteriales bacterium]
MKSPSDRLESLIETFKKEERKRAKAFLESPYHNTNPALVKLFNFYLKNNVRASESMFQSVFPRTKFDIQKLYNIKSLLYRKLLEFISNYQELDSNEINVLNFFRQRGLQQSFQLYSKNLNKKLIERGYQSEEDYHRQYQFFLESDEFNVATSKSDEGALQKKMDHVDLYYLLIKLKTACEMKNRERIVSGKYRSENMDFVIGKVNRDRNSLKEHPLVLLYFDAFRLMDGDSHELYLRLKKELHLSGGLIAQKDAKALINYAQNFCIRKINNGEVDYFKELFELYQYQIDGGLILQEGYISEWDYKTAITVGLRLKKRTWTESFINDFKEYLPLHIQENAYNYNLANFYYEIGNHGQALKMLNTVGFTDVFYDLSSRSVLLKIYFEADDFEALSGVIVTFKAFLKRNKTIAEFQHEIYWNLLKYTQKGMRLIESAPKKNTSKFQSKLKDLIDTIEGESKIANKSWLLEILKKKAPQSGA